MNATLTDVLVTELRRGDEFWQGEQLVWTAVGDLVKQDGLLTLAVMYRDGGIAARAWEVAEASETVLTVRRPR